MARPTYDEDRFLLAAENACYRKALCIALRGLDEARRDAGFARASEIIAEIHAALTVTPLPERKPLWPKIVAWGRRMGLGGKPR
jgi:hypothetical protein